MIGHGVENSECGDNESESGDENSESEDNESESGDKDESNFDDDDWWEGMDPSDIIIEDDGDIYIYIYI